MTLAQTRRENMSDAGESAEAMLCTAFEAAAARDDAAARLADAETSVSIEIRERPGRRVTLRLDSMPPTLERDDPAPVEVEMEIEAQALLDVFARTARLPMMFIEGRASFTGPVRKFLRITPILIAAVDPVRSQSQEDDQ
jgi:hypothetical protein